MNPSVLSIFEKLKDTTWLRYEDITLCVYSHLYINCIVEYQSFWKPALCAELSLWCSALKRMELYKEEGALEVHLSL